ncbi:MAG: hypothetical protein ACI4XS_14240 [Bacillus sp. (in: firmicutes)]
MNIFLMIHKFALLLTLIAGIFMLFKESKIMRNIHYISGIVLVVSIFIYVFQTSFASAGYVLYGLLLLLAFFSPKLFRKSRTILIHTGIVSLSIVWLVLVHII